MEEETQEVVNFGKSLLVPSVKELAKEPISSIPARYVRDDQDPRFDGPMLGSSVPVIDLEKLIGCGGEKDGDFELEKLHSACKDWGFFQVINHGISRSIIEKFKEEIIKLMELPMEEKKKMWQKEDNHEGFGQLFVVSPHQKLDWSDMFYITTLPTFLRRTDLFHLLPPLLRDAIESYAAAAKGLAMAILGQMAKALGMDEGEVVEMFNDGVQSMRMNYYPPCPEPDKAMGFTPHSDADALTILFQLNDTEGLEIKKDRRWVPMKPLPNAFVVNVGDIMEIISNATYCSVEHRAAVNSTKERISVATFYSCHVDLDLGPAKSITGPDNPPKFKRVPVEQYFKGFFDKKLNGKSYLDYMRLDHAEIK